MVRHLKIGDKVRHKESNLEGYVAYSSFGLSVNGFNYRDDELIHFGTQGEPRYVVEANWKRVYKWKYNMLRYESEKASKGD